ncbi:TetR family transcriptional regulator [Aeromicrobium endophyticum]|uniref:TetR family transcriptional regulator n=1 Tax=Aeromicrobium endophyticum TaxID=2292704 RepID=A0A371P136_9ACTN|nr:TetR family transcriptional regulator [Aeromicrobium endophyticum]REK69653.1 TetR family transcriptional regulator [Aeromicrobium endophyticum]
MDRQEIVDAALDLLDEGGEAAVSMRAVANRLHVKAPSLYWHFRSKQDLLEAIADAIVAEMRDLAVDDGDPSEQLFGLLVRFRTSLLGRRDGGRVFAGTFTLGSHVLDLSEAAVTLIVRNGTDDPDDALDTWFNLVRFVVGSVIEQQAATDQPHQVDRRARFEQVNAERPTLLTVAGHIFEPDEDRRFERGVRQLMR